ncbi:unnamed protein product [Linum tenue]|uniref:U-box domain-containing protein n=4 Tax=Linum tenue TaxID=586396 RepID=A0AAV0QFH5_9ROSI|nr:unnamed protein product [Linum tenue]
MEDLEIEIPHYFLCPISLQIMKDPVTAITGITYDRDSIEQWLQNSSAAAAVCPVSKQPLPRTADLTPNHTLRRLIQAWCTLNSVNRIPTPKSPLAKPHVTKLLREILHHAPSSGSLHALQKLDGLASESDRNRATIADAGAVKAMVSLVLNPECRTTGGVEHALRVLNLVWNHTPETTTKLLVRQNEGPLLHSLTWILNNSNSNSQQNQTTQAMCLANRVIGYASASLLERLEPEFFRTIVVRILESRTASKQARRSALQALVEACPWGANRAKIVEADAIHALIELQLDQMSSGEKLATELAFDLLARLCTSADGRERLVGHAAGLAVVAKRTLRVSAATDDRAVQVLGMVARYAAGKEEVLTEMLRVGAVTKLCMVMQADCAAYLKEKARGILREHSAFWNNSPCIAVYLLTWYPR